MRKSPQESDGDVTSSHIMIIILMGEGVLRNIEHGAAVKKLVSQCDRERELRDMLCVAALRHKGMHCRLWWCDGL